MILSRKDLHEALVGVAAGAIAIVVAGHFKTNIEVYIGKTIAGPIFFLFCLFYFYCVIYVIQGWLSVRGHEAHEREQEAEEKRQQSKWEREIKASEERARQREAQGQQEICEGEPEKRAMKQPVPDLLAGVLFDRNLTEELLA